VENHFICVCVFAEKAEVSILRGSHYLTGLLLESLSHTNNKTGID